MALKYDIDILWIGARTTVNPFAVQEIADALKDTDKIVLVKNPVNPDLSLWLGGLERLYSANIKKLGVIHRGFSTYNSLHYRNKPKWHLAIELKKEFPDKNRLKEVILFRSFNSIQSNFFLFKILIILFNCCVLMSLKIFIISTCI